MPEIELLAGHRILGGLFKGPWYKVALRLILPGVVMVGLSFLLRLDSIKVKPTEAAKTKLAAEAPDALPAGESDVEPAAASPKRTQNDEEDEGFLHQGNWSLTFTVIFPAIFLGFLWLSKFISKSINRMEASGVIRNEDGHLTVGFLGELIKRLAARAPHVITFCLGATLLLSYLDTIDLTAGYFFERESSLTKAIHHDVWYQFEEEDWSVAFSWKHWLFREVLSENRVKEGVKGAEGQDAEDQDAKGQGSKDQGSKDQGSKDQGAKDQDAKDPDAKEDPPTYRANLIFTLLAYSMQAAGIFLGFFWVAKVWHFLSQLALLLRSNDSGFIVEPTVRDPLRRLGLAPLGRIYNIFIFLILLFEVYIVAHRFQQISLQKAGSVTQFVLDLAAGIKSLKSWLDPSFHQFDTIDLGTFLLIVCVLLPILVVCWLPVFQLRSYLENRKIELAVQYGMDAERARARGEIAAAESYDEEIKLIQESSVWPNGNKTGIFFLTLMIILWIGAITPAALVGVFIAVILPFGIDLLKKSFGRAV